MAGGFGKTEQEWGMPFLGIPFLLQAVTHVSERIHGKFQNALDLGFPDLVC